MNKNILCKQGLFKQFSLKINMWIELKQGLLFFCDYIIFLGLVFQCVCVCTCVCVCLSNLGKCFQNFFSFLVSITCISWFSQVDFACCQKLLTQCEVYNQQQSCEIITDLSVFCRFVKFYFFIFIYHFPPSPIPCQKTDAFYRFAQYRMTCSHCLIYSV